MDSDQKSYQNTLLLLIVITAVAVDVSIPLLTIVTEHFDVTNDQSQLIISSFLAGYGLSMIPVGLLSDRYGRIPVMRFGIVIYIIAGFITAFAPSFEMVLIGRFFQGIGGGVGPVNARAIARDMASGKDLTKLMSSLTAALFFAPIFAPILGSQLYHYFEWQTAFLVPPILGIILFFSVLKNGYETLPHKNTVRPIGQQLSESLKAFFVSRDSVWALLVNLTSFAGYQIILASSSILMIDIYGIEPNKVGIIFGLTAILLVVATIFNKKLSQNIGPKKLLLFGIVLLLIAAIGFGCCHFWTELPPFWLVWIFFAIYITATGFILPNTSTIALEPLSETAGFASSVFGAAMILGAALSTYLAASFYNGSLISITLGIIICSLLTTIVFFLEPLLIKKGKEN